MKSVQDIHESATRSRQQQRAMKQIISQL